VLVTNCSIYCPTPSLSSMLVNKFKFRQDVQSYHLGGMGCGNGVMALSLLRDLLQVRPAGGGRSGGRRGAPGRSVRRQQARARQQRGGPG
jgi:hypothetical protein